MNSVALAYPEIKHHRCAHCSHRFMFLVLIPWINQAPIADIYLQLALVMLCKLAIWQATSQALN